MKSYLKFLSRNKAYTFISVLGLAVSLMFVILLGDYAWRQFAIDSQHPDTERLYMAGTSGDFITWPQMAGEMQQQLPEVEATCRLFSQCGKIRAMGRGGREVKDDEQCIMLLTDPTFFQFFNFRLVAGNPQSALDAPDKCVITQSLARQLFSDKNAIGETLQLVGNRGVRMSGEDPYDSTLVYRITGIVEDLDRTVLPNETQVIASMERYPQVMGYSLQPNSIAYGATGYCKTLLRLRPNADAEHVRQGIQRLLEKNYPVFTHMDMGPASLTPLRQVMFAPQNKGLGLQCGDSGRLHILFAAVLAILFFAVSNYINLTVANTSFRAKEMATRRLFGSTGLRISTKLIAESTLMVALSFAIGLALAFSFEQDAASLFKGKIALGSDISPATVSVCLGFILLVGIVSGILPSWHLSRYQPIDIVKGSFRFRSKMVLSRVFIVLQNIVTVMMLTSALVIWLQLRHIVQAPMGYNTEDLYLVISPETVESQTLRSRLEQMPMVESVGEWEGSTFTDNWNSMRSITRDDKMILLYVTTLDSTAYHLYGLRKLKDYGATTDGYYLTEEAMRQIGLGDSDRTIPINGDMNTPLNGVLADFHKGNVLSSTLPYGIRLQENIDGANFLVKTNGSADAAKALSQMLIDLGCPADEATETVHGLQSDIRKTLDDRQNTLDIISLFALVAVVISVMGFVGMSLFFIRQRRKDIGIRKIMGATTGEVTWLMLRTFCMPLLLSFVVAVPISHYIMSRWLEDFSYRIALSPWIFAATCAFSLLVAALSVGFQLWRAARTNPVESIKTE